MKMKNKFFLASLMLLFCTFLSAETYNGTCSAQGDNLAWTLDTETGTLTISGTGVMYDYSYNERAPWYSYRSSIKSVIIEDGATSIGDYAFEYCKNLTSVTIPNSVTSIGDRAFYYCSSLTSITIPNSVTSIEDSAFYNCSSLTSVTIGNSVTSIGDYAFSGCSSLTSITIPNSVTSIGDYAFNNCCSLTAIVVENGNTKYDSRNNCNAIIETTTNTLIAGCQNTIIPNTVTSIGKGAFSYCRSLTSVTIPNSVTSIGEGAFYDCSSLTSITIPNSVTSIGDVAFYNCGSLTSVTISSSVTSIGIGAFGIDIEAFGCSDLTIIIPNSVTGIGEGAFKGVLNIVYNGTATGSPWGAKCFNGIVDGNFVYSDDSKTRLIGCSSKIGWDVIIPNNVTSIGDNVFNALFSRSSLTSVTIPNSVTSIGEYAFGYCDLLTSVAIPNSVTSIGVGAFYACSSLTSITIPNSVTSIGEVAFTGCNNLPVIDNIRYADTYLVEAVNKTVSAYTIKEGTIWIGSSAFYGYSGLTSVTIPNSVTSIGEDAFSGCSSLSSITIPNNVLSIGNDAFKGCSSLMTITINSNSIMDNNFSSSHNLGTVFGNQVQQYVIDNSITRIGNYAFYGSSGLTSVTIPNGVTSIGNQAFYNCSSLTSVTIPNSIKSIGEAAFYGCSGLTAVHISDLAAWCKISFGLSSNPLYCAHNLYLNGKLVKDLEIPNSVTSIGAYTFLNCSSLTSVTIPNSVTSIGKNAFYGCRDLTSLLIGENVLSIGEGAFDGCSRLKSVIIPNSVTSIGRDAFYGCSELTSVTIPSSVTSIGKNAFQDCSLQSVIMEPVTPPSLGLDGVFDFVSGYAVYVPLGALTTYQENSQWKYYNLRVFDTSYKTSAATPTSATIIFSASINGANKNNYIAACGIEEGEEFSGNTVEYIGLEPESEYANIPFYIRTTKGDVQTITASFTTSKLELTTKASQPVSANTAILLAETNMSDAETSCGFEWKRNDAPADMPATQVLCPVANGLMAGRLKGLKDDVYYKYRAFYKSAAGNMYYGDWQYIFTGDVTVEFDPILYTYAAQFVTERTATVKGYALAGSEDFTEQGFEYWADSRTANAPARRAPHYEIGEKHTVKGTGISMRVTLNDLDEGTIYKYRTYAKIGDKTLYGTEMSFTTQGTYEEPVVTDLEAINDADNADGDVRAPSGDAPQARKYIRNGIFYIERDGKTYNAQGQRVN